MREERNPHATARAASALSGAADDRVVGDVLDGDRVMRLRVGVVRYGDRVGRLEAVSLNTWRKWKQRTVNNTGPHAASATRHHA
jgi:hypothetical protein